MTWKIKKVKKNFKKIKGKLFLKRGVPDANSTFCF